MGHAMAEQRQACSHLLATAVMDTPPYGRASPRFLSECDDGAADACRAIVSGWTHLFRTHGQGVTIANI
jgi:hypothetical protein